MLGATDSLEIMEICDIFWRKNLCDLLIVWMREMKEKMIFKAFTWQTKLWRMMDVFIILVVEMCIHMSKLIRFVHFKHVQFIVCKISSMKLLKIFQVSVLAKNHPS